MYYVSTGLSVHYGTGIVLEFQLHRREATLKYIIFVPKRTVFICTDCWYLVYQLYIRKGI